MPLPVAYSDTTLATFMHTVLGKNAAALSYTDPGSYTEAVYEVMFALGVTDLSEADDVDRTRRLARREALRMAVNDAAPMVTHSSGKESVSLSHMHDNLLKRLRDAEAAAVGDDVRAVDDVVLIQTIPIHDPYSPMLDEWRVP